MTERIIGIDIGTSSIRVLMGEVDEAGKINVVARGQAESQGVRKGTIVDLEKCSQAVQRAVEEAEHMVSAPINHALVGVGGTSVKGVSARGMIAITARDRRIGEEDKRRVEEQARAIVLPSDYEILHTLPRSYTVDSIEGIDEPLEMIGSRLEAEVHVISASANALQSLQTVVNRAGVTVEDRVLDVLAAAEATAHEDERDMGVAVLDLGAGTAKIALFENKALSFVSVQGYGADYFVKDLSIGCKTSAQNAERLLKRHGCALASLVQDDETVEVEGVQGRKPQIFSRKYLADILQPRAEEILTLLRDDVKAAGLEKAFPAGVILTGGGAMLEGMPEIAESIFGVPARQGYPEDVGGLQDMVGYPLYATGVGLLKWGRRHAPRESSGPMRKLLGKVFGKFRGH
jgi:cell division protein FtsA